MAFGGSRTRDYFNRDARNSTIPESELPQGANELTPYYLLPLQDDWRRRTPTPPAAPTAGDRYIVPLGGSGAWASHSGELAEWDGAAWAFSECEPGATAAVLKEKDRCQLVDFNQADVMLMLTTSSADCVAWVPDSVLDRLEGPYNGLIAEISPDPVTGGGPWSQYIVSAPSTWPTAAGGVADVGSIAMLVVDQATNTAEWVYRNPEVQPSVVTGTAKGSLAYLQDGDKFIFYDHAQTGLSSTHWCVLGNNIAIQELWDALAVDAGTSGWSIVWDNTAGKFVLANIASGTGYTHLYQMLDVDVTEGAGIDGYYLAWDNATSKWIALVPPGPPPLVTLPDVDVTTGVGVDQWSLVWDQASAKFILKDISGGAGVNNLYQLLDCNVTEGAGIDGKFLMWDNATSKWVAHQIVLNDIGQSGATTGQVATWNGTHWVPQTPAASGGFAYCGAAWNYVSSAESWNVSWGAGPRWAVPAAAFPGVGVLQATIRATGTVASGSGYLTITATRRNSLGVAYVGTTDVIPLTVYLDATKSGAFSTGIVGQMQVVAGDYITVATSFAYPLTGTVSTIPIQLMKVG